MRAIGAADRDDALHALGLSLTEGERDHRAVRGADDGMQLGNPEVVQNRLERDDLIEGADRWEIALPAARPRGLAAAAQEIETEHAKAIGVERAARPDDVGPPAFRSGTRDMTPGGDSTERGDDGSARSGEPPCDPHILQRAAEMQSQRTWQREDALAHGRVCARCARLRADRIRHLEESPLASGPWPDRVCASQKPHGRPAAVGRRTDDARCVVHGNSSVGDRVDPAGVGTFSKG